MKLRSILVALALVCASCSAPVHAQEEDRTYPDRVAKVVDVSPDLEITSFAYDIGYRQIGKYTSYAYSWHNKGKRGIVAFEVRLRRFTPFDEALVDVTTTFPGHNSGKFAHLMPDETDKDTVQLEDDDVFTALAYVSKIRFEDGTIWRAEQGKVDEEMKKAAPSLSSTIAKK